MSSCGHVDADLWAPNPKPDAKVVALSTRPVIPCLSRMTSKSDA